MISITYKRIRSLGTAYLIFPFLIFLATWIKVEISIPCLIFLGLGIRAGFWDKADPQDIRQIQIAGFLLILVISFLWCLTAGIGGFFYQSPDHHFRNAVFRDLVYEEWPVIYKDYGTGLVYYLGIWIVPAFLGKVLLCLGKAKETVWMVSEAALLVWCSIGIILLFLLLSLYFEQYTVYGIAVLILIMIGYSGLDIVGELWKNGMNLHDHIEWWSAYFQFRSNTTSIFWAYNQAIPCWLMTILLLSEADMKNYGMIIGSTLFYAPFTVIGVSLCVVAMAFRMVWQERDGNIKEIISELCSYSNIIAVLVFLPVMASYYACNAGCDLRVRMCWEDYGGLTDRMFATWICFLFLEVGIHIWLVAKSEYKNPLFYAVILSLVVGSVISIGETGEVVFRISATMPALFILMCFVMKTVFGQRDNTCTADKVYCLMLSVILAVGIVTPAVEYGRAADTIREHGTIRVPADDLRTLNCEEAPHNFIGENISDTFFYRHMVR